MQALLHDYHLGRVSRRGFLGGLIATGMTAAAAARVVEAAEAGTLEGAADDGKPLTGTGGDLVVE